MTRLFHALSALALVFLASAAGAQVRHTTTPQSPFPEAVHVLDWFDPYEAELIRAKDSLDDSRDEIEAAVSFACTSTGVAPVVSFPEGTYLISKLLLMSSAEGGVGCNNLQLIGALTSFRDASAPTFVAMGDRVGTAERDALVFVRGLTNFTIQGFIFNLNGTEGDGLRVELCNRCTIQYNVFYGIDGVPWAYASSSAANDTITIVQGSSNYQNGTRIEFKPIDTSSGVLPAPLVADTPYFIRDKSGTSFKVAATLGGAAINLTTSVTELFWGHIRTITYDDEAFDPVTDTWTIVNHGLTNGRKVEWATAGGTPTDGGVMLIGMPRYVVNATADTFQVAYEPGGAAIDFTGDGTDGQKVTAYAYAHLRGGGNMYNRIRQNWFLLDDVRAIKMTEDDAIDHGGTYFGCNRCTIEDNDFNSPLQFTGINVINNNTFESVYTYPASAYAEFGDRVELHVSVTNNYVEAVEPGPAGYVVFSTNGPTQGFAWITQNKIFGVGSARTNSACFRISTFPLGGSVYNNYCRGVASCFRPVVLGDGSPGSSILAADLRANACPDTADDGLPDPASVQAGSSTRPAAIINHPVKGGHQVTGGRWSWPLGHTTSDPTSLNLKEFRFYELVGSADIQTLTNADWEGDLKTFLAGANADRLRGTAGFATPQTADLELRPFEIVDVWLDRNETPRPVIRAGETIAHIGPLTAQPAALGVTNLFRGSNPTAGRYRVSGTLTVTTVGSAGTADVVIAFHDGTAARSVSALATPVSLTATNFVAFDQVIKVDGSSMPTIAVPWTGATGSPAYEFGAAVEWLQ